MQDVKGFHEKLKVYIVLKVALYVPFDNVHKITHQNWVNSFKRKAAEKSPKHQSF